MPNYFFKKEIFYIVKFQFSLTVACECVEAWERENLAYNFYENGITKKLKNFNKTLNVLCGWIVEHWPDRKSLAEDVMSRTTPT